MSDSFGALCVEEPTSNVTNHKPYTDADISARFKNYIQTQKPGLERFYKPLDHSLKDPVARGVVMTQQLMAGGCPPEESAALSVLALWDLVVLIDNSISMGIEEGGARVKTLTDTLNLTSTVYSYAEEEGITAVRFMNTENHYDGVRPGKINSLMKKVVYEGLTNMGTKLRDKVLMNYVHTHMKKPLLVIFLSDAEITGEAEGLLRDVILSQTLELTKEHGVHGPDAVAYQFAKIGNDEVGESLVATLDNDPALGRYIDCMGPTHRLENILQEPWRILPKLLLGAISPWWDTETATSNEQLLRQDGKLAPLPNVQDVLEEEEVADAFTGLKKGKLGGGGKGKTGSGSVVMPGTGGTNGSGPDSGAKGKTGSVSVVMPGAGGMNGSGSDSGAKGKTGSASVVMPGAGGMNGSGPDSGAKGKTGSGTGGKGGTGGSPVSGDKHHHSVHHSVHRTGHEDKSGSGNGNKC